jgi:GntR family transcriptional regulator, transcriptional repressor for pyruvate dehydrogenase complex
MANAATFTRRRRQPLNRQVTDHLRRRIVSGDVGPDRQLPSIRKLARMYGVSVPTMHGAIHTLAALGFVRVIHGVGVFAARPRSPATELIYACQEATAFELASIRSTIDQRMPVLAAQTVKGAKGGRLPRALLDLMFFARERSSSGLEVPAEAFVRADLRFHHAIVASVKGMEVSASLYGQIGRRLMPELSATAAAQVRDRGLDRAHLAMAEAITDGDLLATARLSSAIAKREAELVESGLRGR